MANQAFYWNYVDKEKAAKRAIEDWHEKKKIAETVPLEIKEKEEQMLSIHGNKLSDMPAPPKSPQSSDYRIVSCMNTIEMLNKKYYAALEFLDWFMPAWNSLANQEKYILDEFYGKAFNNSAVYKLCQEYSFSDRTIYRIRDMALSKLARELFSTI